MGVPQASVAVAVPKAELIVAEDGLHPSGEGVAGGVIVGGVISAVHVAVTDAVALLPQASMAVNVLVCERVHPLDCTAPSVDVTVGVPQASVAVAVPKAELIAAEDGLHPSGEGVAGGVIVGGVISAVHVAVIDAVALLPQASTAVHVLVWDLAHPLD